MMSPSSARELAAWNLDVLVHAEDVGELQAQKTLFCDARSRILLLAPVVSVAADLVLGGTWVSAIRWRNGSSEAIRPPAQCQRNPAYFARFLATNAWKTGRRWVCDIKIVQNCQILPLFYDLLQHALVAVDHPFKVESDFTRALPLLSFGFAPPHRRQLRSALARAIPGPLEEPASPRHRHRLSREDACPRGDHRYPQASPSAAISPNPSQWEGTTRTSMEASNGRNVRPVSKPLHARRVSQYLARTASSGPFSRDDEPCLRQDPRDDLPCVSEIH